MMLFVEPKIRLLVGDDRTRSPHKKAPTTTVHGFGNPIKNGSADKSDEYTALQVTPNFTPQHFSPFSARARDAARK